MGGEETIRLHPRPGNPRAGALLCGLGSVGGLLLAMTGDDVCVISGLMLAVIFGLVALLCGLSPAPGRIYLDLTPEGLHERGVGASRTFRWRDFDDFKVMSDSEDGPVVSFRFSDAYEGRRPRGLFGLRRRADGVLRDNYGMSARALADLLNDWRRRHARDEVRA